MRNIVFIFVFSISCIALVKTAAPVPVDTCPIGWIQYYRIKCYSSMDTYGRGVGYPWKFGDGFNLKKAKKRCESANPVLGCQKVGEIYYPNCKYGFKNFGCCLCSYDDIKEYSQMEKINGENKIVILRMNNK